MENERFLNQTTEAVLESDEQMHVGEDGVLKGQLDSFETENQEKNEMRKVERLEELEKQIQDVIKEYSGATSKEVKNKIENKLLSLIQEKRTLY